MSVFFYINISVKFQNKITSTNIPITYIF